VRVRGGELIEKLAFGGRLRVEGGSTNVTRGKLPALSFVLACLVLAACDSIQPGNPGGRNQTPAFDLSKAIAISVSADSIYLLDPDSGELRRIVQGLVDFQSGYAAWGPGHRKLAYGNGGVYLLDPSTQKKTTMITGPSLSLPAWSPSGKRLVYGDGSNLWVTPARELTATYVQLPLDLAPLTPDWRPGYQIAFSGLKLDCQQAEGCTSTDQSDIYVVEPDGTRLVKVTAIGRAWSPKWASDATKLLFIRGYTGKKKHRSELWVIPEVGSSARRLLNAPDVVAADWSPDGTQVTYLRKGTRPRTLQLWIADSDGTSPYKVGPEVPGTDATVDW
jgi:Tol biopolymer transport system component